MLLASEAWIFKISSHLGRAGASWHTSSLQHTVCMSYFVVAETCQNICQIQRPPSIHRACKMAGGNCTRRCERKCNIRRAKQEYPEDQDNILYKVQLRIKRATRQACRGPTGTLDQNHRPCGILKTIRLRCLCTRLHRRSLQTKSVGFCFQHPQASFLSLVEGRGQPLSWLTHSFHL